MKLETTPYPHGIATITWCPVTRYLSVSPSLNKHKRKMRRGSTAKFALTQPLTRLHPLRPTADHPYPRTPSPLPPRLPLALTPPPTIGP